jgi:predicted RecA/RadA family phage recombinase
MAKNYVQEGTIITVTAGGTVASGAGVLNGTLFGVAMYSTTSGLPLEIQVEGVFDLPKATADVIAEGGAVYWDNTSGHVTSVSSGMTRIGALVTLGGVVSGGLTARVRLDESSH